MNLKTTARHGANGAARVARSRSTSGRPRETARALPIALLRAREVVMARFRPLVASAGLTTQQWRVLRVLDELGALDPTQIAEHACILMPSLSRMLRSLEDEGHIERLVHPEDKRSAIISITDKARRMLHQMMPESNAIYQELERTYGKQRMRELLDLLEDLAELHDSN